MTSLDVNNWSYKLFKIDFAFQPIVKTHTGMCYGYEALLRNYETAGFSSPRAFFDQAYQDDVLPQVDLLVQKKTIRKFAAMLKRTGARLFLNLDNRAMNAQSYDPEKILALLKQSGLPRDMVCLEISANGDPGDASGILKVLKAYRSQGIRIAINSYGNGFSDLRMLYHKEPDFIKVDPFFIRGIEKDAKKKLLLSNIVDVAHYLGSVVVAVGVETREEYQVCRNIGCDMIQGHLVQSPKMRWNSFIRQFRSVQLLNQKNEQKKPVEDHLLINTEVERIRAISNRTELSEVFRIFRQEEDTSFIPVVDEGNEPVGIIREKSFKNYAYSRYGNELLQNPAFGGTIDKFISKLPIADIRMPTEKILELYALNENVEGIIITDRMKYVGILSAPSLLKVLKEKDVSAARDQNPLSKLPGNTVVNEYISKALTDISNTYFLICFDFDNFKAYNNKYGFRHGDRIILLFSDMLKKLVGSSSRFIGHVGGDDFFMGSCGDARENICAEITQFLRQFNKDVESFYDTMSIRKGFIHSWGADGKVKAFPILTASAAIVELPERRFRTYSMTEISRFAEKLSQDAKAHSDKICHASVTNLPQSTIRPGAEANIFSQSFQGAGIEQNAGQSAIRI